jgi:cytochrome c peroxidase
MKNWNRHLVSAALAALFVGLPSASLAQVTPQEAIGWRLFFDKNLSGPQNFSCVSCHIPDKGYEGGEALSKGTHGDILGRNTPTVVNLHENEFFFWDGRAGSLAEQAKGPMTNPKEMDIQLAEAVRRVSADPAYRTAFQKAGVDEIDEDAIGDAIAAFEATLRTGPTRFDQWVNGDVNALTEKEERGRVVFFTKGDCALCHNGANFADDDFHNIGTGTESDRGRYEIEKDEYYLGAFKTPALRNWKSREPFMHDGRFRTIREVIHFYVNPGTIKVGESEIDPIDLTPEDVEDLVAFLEVLNGDWPELAPYETAWNNLIAK